MTIDINSDLGESFGRYVLGNDSELMKYISSANIACGLHAGDPTVMKKAIRWAKENGVGVGVHPGYPDLQGFGRRTMDMTPEELEDFILYQIGAIYAFAKAEGVRVRHLKCHGALGNDLHRLTEQGKEDLARAVGNAVLKFDPEIIMVGFAGSAMVRVWREMGLKAADEIFADRAYNPDLTLVSRRIPGSVITDPDAVVRRVVDMVKSRSITAIDGTVVKDIPMDTIC
ncbi:MAG: LamB/YcsF family protein, partial [Synergistales bacterium]|nr:LamB/YcsF family protein [Synergistales bacterium]